MVGNVKSLRFFKISSSGSRRMEIPPAFRKHLKDKIPSIFSFVGPSGHTWKVELAAEAGGRGLLFGDGWANFVDDHFLESGDLLLFKYDGKWSFSVVVFDATGCEKASAVLAKPRCHCSCHDRKGKQREVPDSSSESFVSVKLEEEEVEVVKEVKRRRLSRGGGYQRRRRNGGKMSRLGAMRQRKIEEAHVKAFSFKSSRPFFVAVMCKSSVFSTGTAGGSVMRIPIAFSRVHLTESGREITIRTISGRIWIVTLLSNKGFKFFSAGWRRFSSENNLKEDDACVFEQLEKDEMLVNIFRVSEE